MSCKEFPADQNVSEKIKQFDIRGALENVEIYNDTPLCSSTLIPAAFFSVPKSFVNLPSYFWYAKIIRRCQKMFYKSGEVISDQFNHPIPNPPIHP